MRKTIIFFLLCTVLCGGGYADDGFRFWWPWIYRHLTDTNITTSGSNAWAWIQANSNRLNPDSGIWGMDTNMHVVMLSIIHHPEAGLWEMNTNSHIVVSSNYWPDSFWETNAAGNVVLKDVP